MVDSDQAIVSARDLSFNYGRGAVLERVNIVLRRGEMTAVIGPNGSGKSTLLNILSGLLRPNHGQVAIKGKQIGDYNRPELARILGYVPQTPETSPGFTVLETVLAGRFSTMGRRMFENAHDLSIAEQALRDVGLMSLKTRPAGELSGGERQRLALARVLSVEPQILLLDEPTSALDLEHQLRVMQLLESGCRRGLAICLVSHDINLASMFCDQMVLLHEGRGISQGRPEDVVRPDVLDSVYGVCLHIDREPTRGRPRVTLMPMVGQDDWKRNKTLVISRKVRDGSN